MDAASIAAFFAPFMATVATGMPGGICTMEYSESRPPSAFVWIGTPMTGIVVNEAVMPGRCAEPPAPAIITVIPRSFAVFAYSYILMGVLWAETIVISYDIFSSSRNVAACDITGRSESLPIIMPIFISCPPCLILYAESVGIIHHIFCTDN